MEEGLSPISLLRVQLEASELKHRVYELQTIVSALERELKESNSLLIKSRNLPKRPFTSSTEKQMIAARQNWCCATGTECPMRKLTPNGTFSESLYIIDHRTPWSQCVQHVNMRQALCVHCESVKTRNEIATRQYQRPKASASDSETDDEDSKKSLLF